MKAHYLFAIPALAAALALPSVVRAGPPTFGQPAATVPANSSATSPAARKGSHGRFMRLIRQLNLSADQQQRIEALVQQYRTAHPKGSPKDKGAAKALHQQILTVLTPEQQARLKTLRKNARNMPSQNQ